MDYISYQNVRDESWKTLLKTGVNSLPIDLHSVCFNLGIHLYTYDYGAEKYFSHIKNRKDLAFTIKISDEWCIFYNPNIYPYSRVRFAIAHEVGHIINKHHYRHDFFTSNLKYEHQAKKFAIRLLAPAIVLHECNMLDPDKISLHCDISYRAAEIRSKRIKQVENENKFNISKLEENVGKQFRPYIDRYKSRQW